MPPSSLREACKDETATLSMSCPLIFEPSSLPSCPMRKQAMWASSLEFMGLSFFLMVLLRFAVSRTLSANEKALFQKSVDLSLRAYEVGEESINSRHFPINSWILCYAHNDKCGILSKINTFLKKSQ